MANIKDFAAGLYGNGISFIQASASNKWVWVTLLVVGMFGGGYATGRYLAPPNTIVTEKIKEVEKVVLVEKLKTEVQVVKVYIKDQTEKIHRVVVEGIDPPGCKSKTTTEDINIDSVVRENTNSTEIKYVDRVVEKYIDRIVEKEKQVLKTADWRVAGGVGVSIPYFLGQASPGVPGLNGAVIQLELDRRVIGPFYLGLFGNTQGVVGLNLSGIF